MPDTREAVRGPYAAAGPASDATVRLLERMPKAELHLHLDGSLRIDTAIEIARTRGVDAPRTWAAMSSVLVGPPRSNDQAALLEAFDLPQMNPHCLARPNSVVATQALHLMNNAMIHELGESLAERVEREAGPNPRNQISRLYLIALSRPPTEEEEHLALETLVRLESKWTAAANDSKANRAE